YLLDAAHLASFMAALIKKGRSSRGKHLSPDAIDNQDWWGISNFLCSPFLERRLGGECDAVNRLTRQHTPKEDIQRLLEIAYREAQGVEIERLIEQQRHGELIAPEDEPLSHTIERAQLGDAQIRDKTVRGQNAASIGSGTLELSGTPLVSEGKTMSLQF